MKANDAEQAPTQASASSTGSFLSVPNPKSRIDRIPVVGFVWNLYRGYSRRNGPLLSAGIAYYALFSMGPLLLLTLQLSRTFLGDPLEEAKTKILETLTEYLGRDIAAVIVAVVSKVEGPQGYTFAIVGLGILLYGATRLFVRLQVSFNIMWDVRTVSRSFTIRGLLSRLLVFGMILVPTILLVVSLVLGTALSWLTNLLGDSGILINIAQSLIPFFISWLALLIIYAVLPNIHLSWRDCWFPTLLVAIAWAVATRVFGMYLDWSGNSKYAGAVGALVGLIFWTDILAIIALLGVRFNKALYLWRGKVIRPYEFAILVTDLPDADPHAAQPGSRDPAPETERGADGATATDEGAATGAVSAAPGVSPAAPKSASAPET